MAKIMKKKVSKKSRKTLKVKDQSVPVKPEVAYDEDDEEDEDEDVTSGEEEDGVDDERRHQKLLEAISALGGKKRKKLAERSEAAVLMSEFTVNAEGQGDKVHLSDLLGTMDETRAVPVKTKKQLKQLQVRSKTMESPLSKQESQRIQRDVAFQKAAAEVSKWKSVIKQNQSAEQLIFPLDKEPVGPKPVEKLVTGWKARTPLEQEVFALLSANKQPTLDPLLTPAEEASLKAMSLDEAKIRRAELQKARALQSYYEAKARRERKIKSKKYHKVHNKAKRKEFLKDFDEKVKSDPAAALEELNRMEVGRMQERMSLKHQNSGKWAKSKAIMAKYDHGARKAMQQQLEMNKDLTQKLVTSLSREEEEEEEEEEKEEEMLPDFVNDAETGLDSANPWMRGKLTADPSEKETSQPEDTAQETSLKVHTAEEEEEEEEEEEVQGTEEEVLLREFEQKRKRRQAEESEAEIITVNDEEEGGEGEESKAEDVQMSDKEEEQEEEELSEFTSLFRGIAESRREVEAEHAELPDSGEQPAQLEEGLMRVQTLEDLELLSQEETPAEETPAEEATQAENPTSDPPKANKQRKRKRGIELKQVLTKEAKVIRVPLAPAMKEGEDSDSDEELDQRGLIKEAFAGDDVVSDFLKDKKKQEAAAKPQAVDLTLPGWGEWGGVGLKTSRKKRRKFRLKAEPAPERKDRSLPSVIVSEKRDAAASRHQVSSLPFPFQDHAQFESTVRSPTGRTWNTERTVRKSTRPRVVTKLGSFIPPLSREELLKDKQAQAPTGDTQVHAGNRQVHAGKKGAVKSKKRKH
ncbi:U3 small nucleolar RNA-associated protein 14 homolog A [Genypterus blacodes]|uniref:U3 small nucleolar RNA-associated protein 14 homolog A n=1 Tax=Genypterus blacodes TaxID=154954 RepID=UPI003F75D2C1